MSQIQAASSQPDVLTLTTTSAVNARRDALRTFIWKQTTLPTTTASVEPTITANCQMTGLVNLEATQELKFVGAPNTEGVNQQSFGCHFRPARRNGRLVVLHQGHDCHLADGSDPFNSDGPGGLYRTIYHLLRDGYGVLGMYMPRFDLADCSGDHQAVVNLHPVNAQGSSAGSSLQYFIEPVVRGINFAQGTGFYQGFDMVGLSGGGWTTAWAAAIDTRIKTSVVVAGAMPFDFWPEGDAQEQTSHSYYDNRTGYRDLFLMGAHGDGRRQTHVLNRRDNCCFFPAWGNPPNGLPWDANVRSYERDIRNALFGTGSFGMFRVEIDEAPSVHTISRNAVTNVILSELEGARRHIGAVDASDAFVRGANGNLWRLNVSSGGTPTWTDTGLAMVGVPAVLRVSGSGQHSVDVFYRDGTNTLRRAFPTASGWTSVAFNAVVISDPAAVSWGAGRWDVVAFGTDYRLYHWSSANPNGAAVSSTVTGLGTPTLVSAGTNSLDIFFRGMGDGFNRMAWNGSTWALDSTLPSSAALGFPTAVISSGPIRRVYGYGYDNKLYEASKQGNGAWSGWQSISEFAGQSNLALAGTPTAALVSASSVRLATRTLSASNLGTFNLANFSWTFSNLGGTIVGSPTAVPTGAWARGLGNNLWFNSGSGWVARNGWFE